MNGLLICTALPEAHVHKELFHFRNEKIYREILHPSLICSSELWLKGRVGCGFSDFKLGRGILKFGNGCSRQCRDKCKYYPLMSLFISNLYIAFLYYLYSASSSYSSYHNMNYSIFQIVLLEVFGVLKNWRVVRHLFGRSNAALSQDC